MRTLGRLSFSIRGDEDDSPTYIVFHLPIFFPENSPPNTQLQSRSHGVVKLRGNVLVLRVDGGDVDLADASNEKLHSLVVRCVRHTQKWDNTLNGPIREFTIRFFSPSRRSFFLNPVN